jgi:hypothetical protein
VALRPVSERKLRFTTTERPVAATCMTTVR